MEPGTKNYASEFSRMGVKARVYARVAFCVYCKEPFPAKSGKAKYCSKYCSKSCLNKGWYLTKTDAIFSRVVAAHEIIDTLIGRNQYVNEELIKVSRLLDLIENELKKH